MQRRSLVLAALLILSAGCVCSNRNVTPPKAPEGGLSVFVIDSRGVPIVGAEVGVSSAIGGYSQQQLSDSSGRCLFVGMPRAGDYSICASACFRSRLCFTGVLVPRNGEKPLVIRLAYDTCILTNSRPLSGDVLCGKVVDEQCKPIPEAEIVLSPPDKQGRGRVHTDAGGWFHFLCEPGKEYAISVTYVGYVPTEEIPCRIKEEAKELVPIVLRKE